MVKMIKTLLQNSSCMKSQMQEFKLQQLLGVGLTSSVLRHSQVTSMLCETVSTVRETGVIFE